MLEKLRNDLFTRLVITWLIVLFLNIILSVVFNQEGPNILSFILLIAMTAFVKMLSILNVNLLVQWVIYQIVLFALAMLTSIFIVEDYVDWTTGVLYFLLSLIGSGILFALGASFAKERKQRSEK